MAIIALFVVSPLFLAVMLILYFTQNKSVFFTQMRVGKGEKLFKIVKFKTMNDKKDAFGALLPDAERLTKIGSFIRRSSLDEIPQLLNVIKGEMSIVGPRPLLVEYIPLYSEFQRQRHNVKPGITGWAQINGRNSITWQQKFAFDVWYVNHQSFILDLKIIFMTVLKILKREGISSESHATMSKFEGN